ncbi:MULTISPECIES: hypothetical protein [Thermofilum]|jgi:hypothetical protein|uniref:hypothetical protein n=1 Tax=Thermofilum TaxID=2268 RepID=UPI0011E4FCF8|nr:hypothetical protein [Thermofilum adornatum]
MRLADITSRGVERKKGATKEIVRCGLVCFLRRVKSVRGNIIMVEITAGGRKKVFCLLYKIRDKPVARKISPNARR